MIAASRLASGVRTVMPYASWAAYVLQLGYFGYNLYHYYQEYLAQVERDQLSHLQRSLDETIELVVAPRRRRLIGQQDDQPAAQPSPYQENVTVVEGDARQPAAAASASDSDCAILSHKRETNCNNRPPTVTTNSNATNGGDRCVDQENSAELAEQIDRDRLYPQLYAEAEADRPGNNDTVPIDDNDDEDVASLSLESTDSNNGIIKDIYSECFICARTLNDPNKQVATLPFCMHPFHKTCLDGVLKWHHKCPVCDFDIFSPI